MPNNEDFYRFLDVDKVISKELGTETANGQRPTANGQRPTANGQRPTAQTTREKFEEMIYQRGVFENQAKAIMDYAIPLVNARYEQLEIAHKIDWNGLADGYPDPFYPITFETEIKALVVLWIDENIPQAWFRAMFV